MGQKRMINTMHWLGLICVLCIGVAPQQSQASRGIAITTTQGQEVGLYTGSYALLIGVSDYHNGWPKLEQIPSELDKVEQTLKGQGFRVEKILDPDAEALEDGIEDFIDHYGYTKGNRLLFFYSGHGHTMDNGKRGYLVPVDAPDPRDHPVDFKRTALDMNQIVSWCRQMDAKHALFLFDSCFSGTIFKQKDLPQKPPHITRLTSRPVRQFITAGSAGEPVPASSTFTPAFVDVIEHGLADLNKDSYVSGTELGLYLQNLVPNYARQSPQYGKIRDYELSRGDFIFLAGGSDLPAQQTAPAQPKTGSLLVWSEPEGAVVYVDGKRQGEAPIKVSGLEPDSYRVQARQEGFVSASQQVRVRAGKTAKATLRLEPARQVGRLYVNPTPSD
ncbi:MAG: PEGA domain-containing protein, partial [Desulfohalobiaceae bacterium]|nr:PEGA domain-containing protein [Desulfohalobiaceae bacterium]